ncbi:MAG: signal peptide peptidase SppA [Candidatus Dojkabacteria bacterium]|nr:MAG: signal peptide peptidase SppA [Candidatus Dojkabacteria bacterium]
MAENEVNSYDIGYESLKTNHHKNRWWKRGCWWGIGILFIVLAFATVCGLFTLIIVAVADVSEGASSGYIYDPDETLIEEGTSTNKIAVINVSGVITQGATLSPFGSSSGAVTSFVNRDLKKAYDDPDVKAVLLHIESPGGEAVASDLIYQQVKALSSKKPVVVYSSNMVASGGYMIAMGSDYFMTHEGAITGSIGVILQAQSLAGLYEKLGIETATFKSGNFKDDEEIFDENPNGELDQVYQELVDETYQSFVSIVAEGRGMTPSQVKVLADGRVYSGKQAALNGLIDETGYIRDAYEKAEELAGEDGLTIVEYNSYDPWADLFGLKSLSKKAEEVSVVDQPGIQLYYLVEAN